MIRRCASAILVGTFLGASPARGESVPPRDDCGLEPPEVAASAPRPPQKRAPGDRSPSGFSRLPPVRRSRLGGGVPNVGGALSGKTVYLSPGHGFTYSNGAWRTQRGNTNGIVEDLVSAEALSQYLVAYLHAMGAYVVMVREADPNPHLILVDDADAILEGALVETGTTPGWGPVGLPITSDDTNPFAAGSARLLEASAVETGRAVFVTEVPESREYSVYISYTQGPDRVSDAHYIVRHEGGESHFRVDQRRHGSTWVLLGRFWFAAGAPPERASIVVANDSAEPGKKISIDAVRLGGGVGLFDRGGGALPRSMAEHCARYYVQWAGAPPSVWQYVTDERNQDVGARSRFVAWEHEEGEDAVYLAWHTNAPNPGRGTESYTYGPNGPPSPLSQFAGVPGSLELQAAVHDEIVSDIRSAWDASWPDRGKFTAYFGEVNPNHNPETPAVLVEVGFHDTPADADAIRDPRFRKIVSRAMAQGIARYFAEKDGVPLVLPPEPPTAVRVQNAGGGRLVVSWRPPAADPAGGDPPTGYRVYVSRNGYAFDDGVDAAGESHVLALAPGDVRFVRVTAVNAGGESMPSEVVGARVAPDGVAPILVVGGFDRLDAAQLERDDLSAWGLGTVDRMRLDRMNDGTYAARHGAALAAAGFVFDGTTDEAVEWEDVDLAAYQAVDWFVGEESSEGEPLSGAARAALGRLFAAGGRLFVSGAEIGWAMDMLGDEAARAFFRDVLRATFVADDADTYRVVPPTADGPYAGLGAFQFDDPEPGAYDADFPDVLAPGAGAETVLTYEGGASAAIAWEAGIVFGFPFETIVGDDVRRDVMDRTFAHLGVSKPEIPDPDGGMGGGDLGGGCGCRVPGSRAGADATGKAGAASGASGEKDARWLAAAVALRARRSRPSSDCSSPPRRGGCSDR